jgi:hypothetical protein
LAYALAILSYQIHFTGQTIHASLRKLFVRSDSNLKATMPEKLEKRSPISE